MTLDKEDIYDIAKAVVKVIEDKDMMKSEETFTSDDVENFHITTTEKVGLKILKPGEVFKVADREWVVLNQQRYSNTCFAILKNCEHLKARFGSDSNNWKHSSLWRELQKTLELKIRDHFHDENAMVLSERDLTALDGTTDYKSAFCKVSLLTLTEYRLYRRYIPKVYGTPWWLITPASTNNHAVCGVNYEGYVRSYFYNDDNYIRPVCTFRADVLVEKVSD